MSIYKIQEKYLEIFKKIEEAEGEITSEIEAELAITEQDLKDKALNYAQYIKSLEAENSEIDLEIKRLQQLKIKNSTKLDRLENIITVAMITFGVEKVESPTLKLSIRKSESVNVEDESKLSDNFFTTKTTRTVSKTALKDALKSGAEIKGASLSINHNLQIK